MITEISIDNKEEWNRIVKSIEDYDVFYLYEYSYAFMKENKNNGIPILLYYESNGDRAINVVFKRDIYSNKEFHTKLPKNEYFDLISPYGYGGFWGIVSNWDNLNEEYYNYCCNNNYICEFVRFELFSEYHKHYNGIVESKTHNIVRNLDISIEEIWTDFKKKVRKNVNSANRNSLEIIIEYNDTHLDDFLNIYYSTMDRNNAKDNFYFSLEFFERLNLMCDNICYFYVKYNENIISAELVIFGSENCYSYLGGTNRDYFDLRPNDFLKYEIIKWAKSKELKRFVLGGGYGSDDGIYKYKESFAPHGIYDFYIGKQIFNTDIYNMLVSMCEENTLNSDFFPLYRS